VGIPIIYEPFNFVVIFGGLDSNYPQMLFWAGLLNMTNNYVTQLQAGSVKPSLPQQVNHSGIASISAGAAH
jgi:hypothetical protein